MFRLGPTLRRATRRLSAVARVGVYSACVFLAMGLLAARSVYGNAGEASLVIGRELATLRDVLGTAHRVKLNGEPIFVSATVVSASRTQVLDRFEALCRQGSQGLEEAVANPELALTKTHQEAFSRLGAMAHGVLRQEHEKEGAIACLTHQGGGGIKALSDRLQAFVGTKDIGSVGKLRYAFVRTLADGRAQVITAWTDGPVVVSRIVPTDGTEPPGSDPANAPRPPRSHRLITAEVDGAPASVRIYRSEAGAAEVLRSFDDIMPTRGWTTLDLVGKAVPGARAFGRNGVEMLVFADDEASGSSVSLLEMAGRGE